MHLPVRLLAAFGQCLEEVLAVNVVGEDVFAAVAPAHDVVHGARVLDAHLARDGARAAKCRGWVKNKCTL
jgi:hypothetical protein